MVTLLSALVMAVLHVANGAEFESILGDDLTGWMNGGGVKYDGKTVVQGKKGPGWVVKDGALVRVGAGGGYIWTQARYSDFVLELDVKTSGNSGIFFRTENARDPVQTGIELQVHTEGGPGQRHGFCAVYDLQAPTKDVVCDMREWRHITLTCKGATVTVVLDGETVNQLDLNKWTTAKMNPDGSKNKFNRAIKDYARQGHIGFQDHGAEVHYKNIRIKALTNE